MHHGTYVPWVMHAHHGTVPLHTHTCNIGVYISGPKAWQLVMLPQLGSKNAAIKSRLNATMVACISSVAMGALPHVNQGSLVSG